MMGTVLLFQFIFILGPCVLAHCMENTFVERVGAYFALILFCRDKSCQDFS